MADPIIIDDGGSTRIKQIKSATASSKLDELLDNQPAQAANQFTHVKVVFIDPTTGNAIDRGLQALGGLDVEIFSDNGQTVTLSITGSAPHDCAVKVSNAAIVESRSAAGQRRYIVTNAGAINKVNLGAGANPRTLFDKAVTPSLYTMVRLQ